LELLAVAAGVGVPLMLFVYRGGHSGHRLSTPKSRDDLHTIDRSKQAA
jgi:hypothetical protein